MLLMKAPLFNSFRLVGGTNLSLQIGHRQSVDIDLFTDNENGSIDFNILDDFLRQHYPYVSQPTPGNDVMGRLFLVGPDPNHTVKLDLCYTDPFLHPALEQEGIRLATIGDVLAMKLEVVASGGRKKDFWDLHAFIDHFMVDDLLYLHKKRYPYQHDRESLLQQLNNFESADEDFDPICLHGKHWDVIKLDFIDLLRPFK